MKARYWAGLLLLAALGVGFWQFAEYRNQPPEVRFAKARQESITSSVSTNGRVEPEQWAMARSTASGVVREILVRLGQHVAAGQALVRLDDSAARAEMESARARAAQIRTELEVIDAGGRAADRTALQSELDSTRLELETAQRDYDREVRLESKQASTRVAVAAAKDQVDRLEQQISSLERRIGSLVAPTDRASAEARLRDAQSAVELAETRLQMAVVRAPLAGTVYQFDLKPGAYLNPGDEVARIGRLNRVHVNVFVDEPDLGRVAEGQPVSITWDAMPGSEWKGTVDRKPTQIVALGTRQVGEVVCVIENPGEDLLPGTNVNAVIESETADNAITIPKEALLRVGGQTGVYVLDGDRLAWRAVTEGVNNVTRTQVFELKAGEAVALPSGRELSDGMIVQPAIE